MPNSYMDPLGMKVKKGVAPPSLKHPKPMKLIRAMGVCLFVCAKETAIMNSKCDDGL